MKTITTGVKKTAAAAALAGLALIGATSLTAAGDELVAIETTPIVEPAPEATGLPVPPPIVEEPPAELPEPILPAEPELTAAPAPEPEPTFDYVEAVPWVPGAPIGDLPPEIIHEDDPRFDCRYMGNQRCGVEIHGTVYVITFENGAPTGAYQR